MGEARFDFGRWPKTDLHCHLDGSLRPASLVELGREAGHAVGALGPEAARALVAAGPGSRSLPEYLEAFATTVAVLQTEEALERAAFELVEDAAAESVWWLELRFCPFLHRERGLSLESVTSAVARGARRGAEATGVGAGVILSAMRNRPPSETMTMVELAGALRAEGVVGVDLAGPEAGYSAAEHAEAFRAAGRAGLGVTIHAGEADGPESVWAALDACAAVRVGHGCRAVEDPKLVGALRERRVLVEVCPLSNLQTGAVRALEAHPMRALREAGVAVTVATDNRLITGTTVSDELERVVSALGWGRREATELVFAGFEGAFTDGAETLTARARAMLDANSTD